MFYFGLIVLKCIAFFLSLLPRPVFLALGHGLGGFLRRIGFRTEISRANLTRAYPSLPDREDLFRSCYRELGVLFLELFRYFYRFRDFLDRNVDYEGEENLRSAMAEGKGVFVMTAHLGNWEVLTASGPNHFGVPVTMVTKRLKPAWLHRAVELNRSLLGIQMAFEPRTLSEVLRALRKKEIVGFVMDQFTGAPFGARVPFFGIPVGSHTALATLAIRTGAPVVPAVAIRQPNGRYLLRFEPALPTIEDNDYEKSVILNTANYVRHTENWVRENPSQWMWIHRRWKGNLSPLPEGLPGEMMKD